jgi:cytochrome c biogenesis protein CcdA
MAITSMVAPIALIIIAVCFFFTAYGQRKREQPIISEVFFMLGGLLAIAASLILFNTLNIASVSFAGVVLPVFGILIWAYIILLLIIFVKLLLHLVEFVKIAIKSIFRGR